MLILVIIKKMEKLAILKSLLKTKISFDPNHCTGFVTIYCYRKLLAVKRWLQYTVRNKTYKAEYYLFSL